MAAHDLTDEHRTLLSDGSFAYLLTQDIHYCVGVAARVLRALCENVRGALNVVQPRVEILTSREPAVRRAGVGCVCPDHLNRRRRPR